VRRAEAIARPRRISSYSSGERWQKKLTLNGPSVALARRACLTSSSGASVAEPSQPSAGDAHRAGELGRRCAGHGRLNYGVLDAELLGPAGHGRASLAIATPPRGLPRVCQHRQHGETQPPAYLHAPAFVEEQHCRAVLLLVVRSRCPVGCRGHARICRELALCWPWMRALSPRWDHAGGRQQRDGGYGAPETALTRSTQTRSAQQIGGGDRVLETHCRRATIGVAGAHRDAGASNRRRGRGRLCVGRLEELGSEARCPADGRSGSRYRGVRQSR
jgi:hypothetical protein